MDILSHQLSKNAMTWASALSSVPSLSTDHFCEARDVLRGRIDSLTIRLFKKNIPEGRVRLLDAVLSEIGSNSFDHNIGQWRDTSGVLFMNTTIKSGTLCILADRGQGLLTTLSRIRPELTTDEQALHVAFTERISGRAPEQRGNGLKFVRNVLLEDGIDLWYGSGTAAYGCCAILKLHHS